MRRTPQQSRFLGVWSAAWLFVLLLIGLLWVGDLALQWPVLLVPVLWALVALRPRRGTAAPREVRPRERPAPRRDRPAPREEEWDDEWPPAASPEPPARPLPPTRELPWLPEPPRRRREE